MIFCRSYYYFRPPKAKARIVLASSCQKWGEISFEIGKWLSRFCFPRRKGANKINAVNASESDEAKRKNRNKKERKRKRPFRRLSVPIVLCRRKLILPFDGWLNGSFFLGHFWRDFIHTINTALIWFLAIKKQLNLVYFGLKIPFFDKMYFLISTFLTHRLYYIA